MLGDGDRSHWLLARSVPLNRFMAASIPWVTQTATACEARIRASSMTVRSALRNRLRTKSAASMSSWSPMPIRRRGNWSVPRWAVMSRRPFLAAVGPARPEPQLAQGQAQVVADDQEVGERQLVEPHRLADRAAAQVHERLGLQEQDAADSRSRSRRAGPRTCARTTLSSRPAPGDRPARSRYCAVFPGTCCPGCPGRPPVSSSPTPRLPAVCPGLVRAVMTGRAGSTPAARSTTTIQISLPCLFPCARA